MEDSHALSLPTSLDHRCLCSGMAAASVDHRATLPNSSIEISTCRDARTVW
jgi:hypothetical protein